jgi:hypothetical protein
VVQLAPKAVEVEVGDGEAEEAIVDKNGSDDLPVVMRWWKC